MECVDEEKMNIGELEPREEAAELGKFDWREYKRLIDDVKARESIYGELSRVKEVRWPRKEDVILFRTEDCGESMVETLQMEWLRLGYEGNVSVEISMFLSTFLAAYFDHVQAAKLTRNGKSAVEKCHRLQLIAEYLYEYDGVAHPLETYDEMMCFIGYCCSYLRNKGAYSEAVEARMKREYNGLKRRRDKVSVPTISPSLRMTVVRAVISMHPKAGRGKRYPDQRVSEMLIQVLLRRFHFPEAVEHTIENYMKGSYKWIKKHH